ncbi:MAG: M20/M25/M40 family metallo-hydrolase, partial [Mesorhizobium sp.]
NIRVTVTGTPGHSGRAPDFVNAVHFGARLIVKIQNMAKRLADDVQDELYDIPCTTAHVGTAHGGAALNIVPEHFEFLFEFRAIAAHDLDELVAEVEDYARDPLLPEMRAIDTRADIQFEVHADSPGMDIAVDHPLTRAVQRYAQRNDLTKIIYGTEGGIFQKIGRIPTIICGPGTIDVAHKPDEFIEKGQLAQCEAFLERLILDCRSGQLDIQL